MNNIGIDIGGTTIKGGIVDQYGNILLKKSVLTISQGSLKEKITSITAFIEDLIEENIKMNGEKIGMIGIGVPGIISRKKGIAEFSGNLNWNNVELVKLLKENIKIPIMICNDSRAATVGEKLYGIGKKYDNMIMITIGTGIGAGIILNNKLFEGNGDKGGEIGHEVIMVDGEECTCSRRGCFEAYASARALIRDTKKKMLENKNSMLWDIVNGDINKINGESAFECAKNGDNIAIEIVERYVKFLSEGILNVCNAFRPEAIIIGGGISEQGEFLLEKIKKYVSSKNYGYKGTPEVDIVCAQLGNDAGIIGAAMLNQML